jgi:hypothetical protein
MVFFNTPGSMESFLLHEHAVLPAAAVVATEMPVHSAVAAAAIVINTITSTAPCLFAMQLWWGPATGQQQCHTGQYCCSAAAPAASIASSICHHCVFTRQARLCDKLQA